MSEDPDRTRCEACGLRTMRLVGAERLADEVERAIRRKLIDPRDPVADALLDYREPGAKRPQSPVRVDASDITYLRMASRSERPWDAETEKRVRSMLPRIIKVVTEVDRTQWFLERLLDPFESWIELRWEIENYLRSGR